MQIDFTHSIVHASGNLILFLFSNDHLLLTLYSLPVSEIELTIKFGDVIIFSSSPWNSLWVIQIGKHLIKTGVHNCWNDRITTTQIKFIFWMKVTQIILHHFSVETLRFSNEIYKIYILFASKRFPQSFSLHCSAQVLNSQLLNSWTKLLILRDNPWYRT